MVAVILDFVMFVGGCLFEEEGASWRSEGGGNALLRKRKI
jgi:hypothetical protein